MEKNRFLLWEQSSRDTIDLKKVYIDVAGDLVTGVLLSQIIYWNLPNKEGCTKLRVKIDGDLWLAKGREDWWDECRISAKQFDRSIKILEDKKIVKTTLKKFDGAPMKHIYLDLDELTKQIDAILFPDDTEGEMDIPQKVNSIFPKGKNGYSPKGKNDITERVKSLTETTTEITTETTSERENTPSPDSIPVDNLHNFLIKDFSKTAYGTWIANLIITHEGDTVTIKAPDVAIKGMVASKYMTALETRLKSFYGANKVILI